MSGESRRWRQAKPLLSQKARVESTMPRISAIVVFVATTFVGSFDLHAQANRYPEYQKKWEDGALRKPLQKGLKANASRNKARPDTAHVAISLGDGRSLEGKKSDWVNLKGTRGRKTEGGTNAFIHKLPRR